MNVYQYIFLLFRKFIFYCVFIFIFMCPLKIPYMNLLTIFCIIVCWLLNILSNLVKYIISSHVFFAKLSLIAIFLTLFCDYHFLHLKSACLLEGPEMFSYSFILKCARFVFHIEVCNSFGALRGLLWSVGQINFLNLPSDPSQVLAAPLFLHCMQCCLSLRRWLFYTLSACEFIWSFCLSLLQ